MSLPLVYVPPPRNPFQQDTNPLLKLRRRRRPNRHAHLQRVTSRETFALDRCQPRPKRRERSHTEGPRVQGRIP